MNVIIVLGECLDNYAVVIKLAQLFVIIINHFQSCYSQAHGHKQ